ncbi:bile acid:sodium symporter family protein [Corynebacterium mendelii]|uniref:Bile acid:sodium symporter n=1 Tax=Corynebacterium mendelii TaxID=2765362 RepID=A0A939IVM2_9CORY|nr:bile acid:sodium symporter family protein [Corynebacterium mendelii]MBN9644376.1 bile acid:sodium symporter [Corynebacterium mendelii]
MNKPGIRIDPLIVLIIGAVIVAAVFPVTGQAEHLFTIATKLAIALLFFLYGARLSPQEALRGLKHWRLHLTILVFTFVVFPLIGIAMAPLSDLMPHGLFLGLVYLTLVPSTVQSSVAFTSISRGNVAGAIVSASASNLLGVVITPLLVLLVMAQGSGVHIDGQVFADIAIQLLLPFALGQLTRRWVKNFAAMKATKIVDRGSITMVVYSAFSAGMVEGIWAKVSPRSIVFLVLFSIAVVLFMLWLTRFTALRLGFDDSDMKAIQFCGTKKSLATGLPMAAVIFGGAGVGLLILPLMIFHQVQLMMCAWLAGRYATAAATSDSSRRAAG